MSLPQPEPSRVLFTQGVPRDLQLLDKVLAGVFTLVVMCLAFSGLMDAPVDGSGLFCYSLKYSVPALAIVVFAAAMAAKGKTWFRSFFARVTIWSVLLFPTAGYCAACLINSRLDSAPPVSHTALVISTSKNGGGSRQHYWMRIQSWNEGVPVSLRISQSFYGRIHGYEGQRTVLLKVKPGQLGYEWIQGLTLQSTSPFPG